MSHERFFRATTYTGWDVLLHLLPQEWQARAVEKRIRRDFGEGVAIQLPSGLTFRVTGKKVERVGAPPVQ